MKVIIIEDEKLNAEHLLAQLKKIIPGLEVVAMFDTVKESIAAFSSGLKADLLFVDIHLADGLSFEIFSSVKIDIPVIFTTAYDEYALRAFKVNSIDYLLKPVGRDDLQSALEKYHRVKSPPVPGLLEELAKLYKVPAEKKSRFMVKLGEQIITVRTEDICFFIFEDGFVLLCTKAGKRFIVDYTLDQLESMVDSKEFFRINRKVLLAISCIEKVAPYFNSRLMVSNPFLDSESSVVSRERVSEFKVWLGQ